MGNFIVIDGNDGVGKTSLISNLKKILNSEDFLFVKDPGQTPLGEKIRTLLLSNDSIICPISELLLFAASRAQMINDIIRPTLQVKNVISDRFTLSTMVYQSEVKKYGDFESVINFGLNDCQPNLTILLDAPPEISLSRITETRTKDRMESVHFNVIKDRRDQYLEYAKKLDNIAIIDATKTQEEILKNVLDLINNIE